MKYSRPKKLLPIQMHNMNSVRQNNRLILKGSMRYASKSIPVSGVIRSLERMQDQLGVIYSNYNIMQRLGHSAQIKNQSRKTLSVPSISEASPVESLTAQSGPHEIKFISLAVTDQLSQETSKAPHSFLQILLSYSKDEIAEIMDKNAIEGEIFRVPSKRDLNFDPKAYFISDKTYLKAKTEIVQRRKVGEFVKKIENRGLQMIDLKLEDKDANFVVCVKGERAIVNQLALAAEDLGISSLRIVDEASYLKPPYEINTGRLKIVLPYISFHSRQIPVPLGILDILVQNDFKEWDKHVKDLLKNPAMNTSYLKANCSVHGEAVVLTLNAPKLVIPEIKTSVSFKLSELSLFTFENCERIIVESINLEETSGIRKKWNAKLRLPDLELPNSSISFDFAGQVTLNGTEMNYKIEPPIVEMYNPLTGESQSVPIPPNDILSFLATDFSDWESSVTSYFT